MDTGQTGAGIIDQNHGPISYVALLKDIIGDVHTTGRVVEEEIWREKSPTRREEDSPPPREEESVVRSHETLPDNYFDDDTMDSDEDIIDRNYLTDDDELVEARECVTQFKLNKSKMVVDRTPELKNQFIEEDCERLSDDSNSSYSVVSSENSDDDHTTRRKSKFVSFEEKTEKIFFCLGMKFTGPAQLKDAITKYALQERRAVKLVRNTKRYNSTDQQKGLLDVVCDILPSAEHRCCARHLYANLRKKHGRSELLQRQFWACAKSANMPDFEANMMELKKLSPRGFEDILHTHPKHWCKAYFTTEVKCDIVDNNLIEAFNGKIIEARTKNVISMFEDIRKLVMRRLPLIESWLIVGLTGHNKKGCPTMKNAKDQSGANVARDQSTGKNFCHRRIKEPIKVSTTSREGQSQGSVQLRDEPEPSFMTNRTQGFKKWGKQFITSSQLKAQVNKKKRDQSSATVGVTQKKKKNKVRGYIATHESTI
ncbi:hypothetical protein POM88_034639 [Heracleum sosnowskyi]|uniref:Transposase n=1 Tax=Heracleum sosnowskyi TaxID=360622 RepID=A0AAD8HLT1_9APIA|nr:hypothetical protein POM88_034639 [Heracleum sosnowskyi]